MNNVSPVKLVEVPNSIEAAVVTGALEAQGIQSFTTGDFTSGFQAEAPGFVTVLVRPEDMEAARAILAEAQAEDTTEHKGNA